MSETCQKVKLLSLCTGYGGLDLAVEEFFDAELIGCADIDKSASLAIEKHFKVPNYGDIRNILNLDLEIDILTAGYPCQPFSHAGNRKGLNDERHIWPYIAQIIGNFRPDIVILENVRGHLSLGFKEVLADLAENGYDAKWDIIRASEVGAPHQRARLFVIAYSNSPTRKQSRRVDRAIRSQTSEILNGTDRQESWNSNKVIGNTNDQQLSTNGQTSRLGRRFKTRFELQMQTPPDALVDGKLNTRFVEYMMGLPEGWVTDLPISRAQQFKLLGNGVVPQQAYYALEQIW
jgi:DNA (cytosine-5)-methyltransferase 1